jgi:2'-hydroxyisoflavone reductase
MRLLVLGGTKFLGRHAVAHALADGHEVTTFTRGRTNPELFPNAEHLTGDRDGGLDALRARSWDGVIDTSGYVPHVVRQSAELLRDAVARYLFVSTISVYGDPEEEYGANKLASERVVEELYGDRCTIVRPGLIVGPHDPTDRFTYWPRRLAAGGDVLAPGDPAQPLQLIDARDLAPWLVRLALHGPGGTFDATSPQTTLGDVLERLRGGANLVWMDGQRVLDAGVEPWMELPLWLPEDGWPLMERDVSAAVAAGLTFRPLEETARDTLAWDRAEPGERPTLAREKEAEILRLHA